MIREILKIKSSSELSDVITEANTKLFQTFGMRLVKLPKHVKKSTTGSAPQTATQATQATQAMTQGNPDGSASQAEKDTSFSADSIYILQNALPYSYREQISAEAVENRETGYMGMVSIVVSIIAFSGGTLEGPVLTRYLSVLGLDQKLKQTSLVSIDDSLKLMQKHMYIEKESRTIEGDQNRQFIKYHLGRRAVREFTKEGLVKQCQNVMEDAFLESTSTQLESQFKHTGILAAADIPQLPSRRPLM